MQSHNHTLLYGEALSQTDGGALFIILRLLSIAFSRTEAMLHYTGEESDSCLYIRCTNLMYQFGSKRELEVFVKTPFFYDEHGRQEKVQRMLDRAAARVVNEHVTVFKN